MRKPRGTSGAIREAFIQAGGYVAMAGECAGTFGGAPAVTAKAVLTNMVQQMPFELRHELGPAGLRRRRRGSGPGRAPAVTAPTASATLNSGSRAGACSIVYVSVSVSVADVSDETTVTSD